MIITNGGADGVERLALTVARQCLVRVSYSAVPDGQIIFTQDPEAQTILDLATHGSHLLSRLLKYGRPVLVNPKSGRDIAVWARRHGVRVAHVTGPGLALLTVHTPERLLQVARVLRAWCLN